MRKETPALSSDRVSIDKLIMTVPQMSQADANRLAELVAEALRDWPTAPDASGRITSLSATVIATEQDAAAPSRLAAKIAEAVLAAAVRELT
jgi:hypothetical protein